MQTATPATRRPIEAGTMRRDWVGEMEFARQMVLLRSAGRAAPPREEEPRRR